MNEIQADMVHIPQGSAAPKRKKAGFTYEIMHMEQIVATISNTGNAVDCLEA